LKRSSQPDFESPWDAFAILDRLQIYQRDDFLCMVTRGAENGGLISEVSVPRVPTFLWAQDDGMTETHRHTPLENRPSSRWINSVKHAHNGVAELRVLLPPIGFKDWCDYTRSNGSTAESIRRRVGETKPEPEPEVNFESSTDDGEEEEEQIEPFPFNLLAPIQAQMVEATAESIRVHPNLPAIATFGAVSAAIGRGLHAKSGPNQTIRGNIFILGSAISGDGKSEGCRPLVAQLVEENSNRIQYYKEIEHPSYCSRQRLYLKELQSIESALYGRNKKPLSTADKKALRDRHQELLTMLDELKDQLVEPAMLTEDCTQEMMAVLMARNNEQLFSFSADASKAIDNLEGLYNKLSVPEDNFMVHCFSGDPCSIHRISRPAINLQHPCLNQLWFLQPIHFERMLANDRLREAGFLVRLLISDTRLEPRESDGTEREIPPALQQQYDDLIRLLITTYWDSKTGWQISVDPDGQKLFRDYQNELVGLRKGDLKDINSFVARWPEQARRIAIGQHAALHGDQAHLIRMADSTIANSITIVRWFANEQLRMLQACRQKILRKQMEELRDLVLNQYPQGVTLRTLRKSHGKSEQFIEGIVKAFPTIFALEDYQPPGAGRPTRRLVVKIRRSNF
jgi:dsDNA-binding SOS-regulon protein